eukprot:TRINITY_DN2610_c0_g1_i1.p1 TRINITY_DN2610_c0_g1~~TRINITY_DN2610_c0_g1_i1.p1  ORF type:complete len:106 (+),score=18.26 TRINITY_DN2610_c0_g1_i1:132-449(+)
MKTNDMVNGEDKERKQQCIYLQQQLICLYHFHLIVRLKGVQHRHTVPTEERPFLFIVHLYFVYRVEYDMILSIEILSNSYPIFFLLHKVELNNNVFALLVVSKVV